MLCHRFVGLGMDRRFSLVRVVFLLGSGRIPSFTLGIRTLLASGKLSVPLRLERAQKTPDGRPGAVQM